MPERGYLFLDKFENSTLSLQRENGANLASNPVCEWKVIVNNKAKLVINISRNASIYEDIRIEANFGSDAKVYTSKDLLSCGLTKKELVLDKTSILKVRVQILDDRSDYLITLEQILVENNPKKQTLVTVL